MQAFENKSYRHQNTSAQDSYSDSNFNYAEFSSQHLCFLKEKAPANLPKTIVMMFNEEFNSFLTKKELKEICIEHNITYQRKNISSDWNEDQKKYLIQIAPYQTFIECAQLLNEKFGTNRTPKAIRHMAEQLKITTKKCSIDNWNEEMFDFLRIEAPAISLTACTAKFNEKFSTEYTDSTIRRKCEMLGVQCKTKTLHIWSKDEKAYLREIAPKNTIEKIAELFNKKFEKNQRVEDIRNQCARLKIKPLPAESKTKARWTDEKLAFLRELAKNSTLEQCTKAINAKFGDTRTKESIKQTCKTHKIKYVSAVFKILPEHVEFLQQVGPGKTAAQCAKIFNEKFQANLSDRMISLHCKTYDVALSLLRKRRQPAEKKSQSKTSKSEKTENKIEFLKKTAKKHTLSECTEVFNKKFGETKSTQNIKQICKDHKIIYLPPLFTIQPEHTKFLKKKAPRKTLKEITAKFNKKFETQLKTRALKVACNDLGLKHIEKQKISSEQIEFLKKKAPRNTLTEIIKLFNEKFGENKSRKVIKHACKTHNVTYIPAFFEISPEHIEFLKKEGPGKTLKEITKLFNEKFNASLSDTTIRSHCKDIKIKLKGPFKILAEHIEFLQRKGPRKIAKDLTTIFNDKFGASLSIRALQSHCTRRKIQLKAFNHQWTKEELDFLKQNGSKYTIPECLIRLYKKFHTVPDEKVLRGKLSELPCIPKSKEECIEWNNLHSEYFKSLNQNLSFTERVVQFNVHFDTKISTQTVRAKLNIEKMKSTSKSADVQNLLNDTTQSPEKECIYPDFAISSLAASGVTLDTESHTSVSATQLDESSLLNDLSEYIGQI